MKNVARTRSINKIQIQIKEQEQELVPPVNRVVQDGVFTVIHDSVFTRDSFCHFTSDLGWKLLPVIKSIVEFLEYGLSIVLTSTNDFSEDNKIGEGGFGSIYKKSEGGLFVDINTFLVFGKDYVGWNFEKTSNPVS
ncbi:hypothetical protein L1987_87113 [Smallanthus sonchifolius]|nr:hypothetical protein L1987_87113 [Smallanthus sonchifolius]